MSGSKDRLPPGELSNINPKSENRTIILEYEETVRKIRTFLDRSGRQTAPCYERCNAILTETFSLLTGSKKSNGFQFISFEVVIMF
jgi:hypothetical protein